MTNRDKKLLLAQLAALRLYREELRNAQGNVIHVLSVASAQAALELLREKGIEVVVKNGKAVSRRNRGPEAVRQFVDEEGPGFLRYLEIKARQRRQSRGTGGFVPSPKRPDIPPQFEHAVQLGEALRRNLWTLHHTYAEAVDRMIGHFVRLQKEPTASDDPILAMAESIQTCQRTVDQQRGGISGQITEWRSLSATVTSAEIRPYVDALNRTIDRLWASEPFGRGWLVFIEHVLLALAAAFVLRRKDPKSGGAQVAALIAACRSLRPLLQSVPDDVPVEKFGISRGGSTPDPVQHTAGEHELRKALRLTVRAAMTPARAVGQKSRGGRIGMILSASRRVGVPPDTFVEDAAIDVALTGWEHLPIVDLYRQALAGRFSHAMDRVSDRAFDAAGKELRQIAAPSQHDQDRLVEEYRKRTGKSAIIGGRPTRHFRKFVERRTRYTGRRVQWETIFKTRRQRPDEPFDRVESDNKRGAYQLVKDVQEGDLPSSTPTPFDELAGQELLEVINSNPLLRAYAQAAVDVTGAKAIATRLGISEDGVKKRKGKLAALLKKNGY